ncbi:MAG: ABC transporter ATP-binding protein [Alphaproteobacteria bacterium]|nr:ABC transporter ATP-binding protein [Alphaproteobacteria bacterium]
MKLFEKISPMHTIPENPLLFIWESLFGMRKWALLGMVLAFCLQLMKVFVPVYFSEMIQYFSQITPAEFSWTQMWWFLAAIFASYIGQSVFRTIRELVENYFVRTFMNIKISTFGFDYLEKHSESYFSSQKTGQLSQKVTNCAEAACEVHGHISRLYSNLFLILINLFFIGTVDCRLLLMVIIFGLLSAFSSYKASIKIRKLNEKSDNIKDDFSGMLADSIGNALNVKASGCENFEISFIKKAFKGVKNARINALNAFQDTLRVQQTLLCLFEVFALLFMIRLWYLQKINVGEVTMVLVLMNSVMSCFSGVLDNVCELNSAIGGLSAAMAPFVIKHEIVDVTNAHKLKIEGGEIEFKNVSFAYENKKVFRNLSFKIKSGEKVGIVGISGSGKSTLINLLQRAYDIQKGEILIDNQNIAKVTQNSLHDAIALIPQDTSLFHRSISQNIAYGKQGTSQKEILNAAKKAYADNFIKELAKGYQTKVGEKGVKLSGGQRQRIAIARAILKNSPILILDEATSALDSKTEMYIQKAMNNLMKNKTVIAIAHRLSTLKEMDRIIVLDKGKIVEQGKVEDLLKSGGEFQHLWEIQNETSNV